MGGTGGSGASGFGRGICGDWGGGLCLQKWAQEAESEARRGSQAWYCQRAWPSVGATRIQEAIHIFKKSLYNTSPQPQVLNPALMVTL